MPPSRTQDLGRQAELVVGEADGRPEVCLALTAGALSLWASHRRLAIAAALCAEVAAAARRAAAVLAHAGPSAPGPARVCAAVFQWPLKITRAKTVHVRLRQAWRPQA